MKVRKYLKQDCVYWPPEDRDAAGQIVYGEPEPLKCRWEDVVEQFYDERGELTVSKSKVLFDVDFKIGGLLLLGKLEDVPYPSDPLDDDNGEVAPIRSRGMIPDRKGRPVLYIAYL